MPRMKFPVRTNIHNISLTGLLRQWASPRPFSYQDGVETFGQGIPVQHVWLVFATGTFPLSAPLSGKKHQSGEKQGERKGHV